MKLFSILTLAYLLLVIADDFAVWAFNAHILRLVGGRDTESLPRPTYRKALAASRNKKTVKTVIRVIQSILIAMLASAVIVGVGVVIITN